MRRMLVTISVVVGLVTLISASPAPTPAPALVLPQRLSQRADFAGIEDPRVTLDDALEKLSKLYDVSFDINESAFLMDGLMNVGKTEIAQPTPIPARKNIRLSEVLRRIMRRIPVSSGATYTIRDDRLEITTNAFQRAEIWGGKYGGPFLPLVNATLDKCPLEDAMYQLTEQAEFNFMLDSRVTTKAKTPVSARLLNTPLDTALRLLADMADLRVVHLDNVFYITSKENAAELEKQLEKEKEKSPMNNELPEGLDSPGWRKGSGRLTMPYGGGA